MDLEFVEIGIIRESIRTAQKEGHITRETLRACENLIDRLDMIIDAFRLIPHHLYVWHVKE